jgi:lysophospholipase L1-like esterase
MAASAGAYVDTLENFAADYAHFNVRGQAAMAELIWPVVEELLGL